MNQKIINKMYISVQQQERDQELCKYYFLIRLHSTLMMREEACNQINLFSNQITFRVEERQDWISPTIIFFINLTCYYILAGFDATELQVNAQEKSQKFVYRNIQLENPNAKVFKVGCKLRQNTYYCVIGVVRALANNSIHDTLFIYVCSRNSQLMKCIHASPSVYGMHRAGRQEYEAISLSTYSDYMNLRNRNRDMTMV